MTAHKNLKSIIRERQRKTGESYTAARVHVLRARNEVLGIEDSERAQLQPDRIEAVVLSVGVLSARVRVRGEANVITVRTNAAAELVPGHVVRFSLSKRWTFSGHAYASGKVHEARVDASRLGVEPLPLRDTGLVDLREVYENHEDPDPYAPMWRELTAKPRRSFNMDPIAWGAFPDSKDPEENITCDAADLAEQGESERARDLLMQALRRDLRCIDAHVHLGNLVFDRSAHRALQHYEMGVQIGELSFPTGFEGLFLWGPIYNRPFLRALYNSALCCWRLGRTQEADAIFTRVLTLNPPDNQGARFCLQDLRKGITWETMRNHEARAEVARFGPLN